MTKYTQKLAVQEVRRRCRIWCTAPISCISITNEYLGHPESSPTIDNSSKVSSSENLEGSLKFLLIVGRLIGVLPLNGVAEGRDGCLRFRWLSVATVTSLVIIISLGINVLVGLVGFFTSPNVHIKELANNFKTAAFFGTGLIIYVYMLLNARKLLTIFKTWNKTKLHFQFKDVTLKKDVILITTIFSISIILENLLRDVGHFLAIGVNAHSPNISNAYNMSGLETLYSSTPEWEKLFEFHPATVIFIVLSSKFAIYGWNFVEIFIIACSRVIYYKFKRLAEFGISLGEGRRVDHDEEDKVWMNLVLDHSRLWHILIKFDEFLSPLILVAFSINVYFICTRIAQEISSAGNTTILGRITITWAFLHICIRFYFVYKSASNINIYANELHKALRKCPTNYYSSEIEKYEKQVYYNGNAEGCGGSGIGLSGMGYFIITKPIMLHVVGVIFTVELVFLQTSCN